MTDLWDLTTGKRVHRLAEGQSTFRSATYTADGRLVLIDHAEDNLFEVERELVDDRHALNTVSVSGTCGTTGCIDNGGDRIVVANVFKNGDFVTYHAPTPVATGSPSTIVKSHPSHS